MNISRRAMAAAVVLSGIGIPAGVSAQPASYDGYAVGGSSGVVVKNPFGLCWRTYSWTTEKANAECDPSLVARPAPAPAPAPAPVVVAPPPPPVVVARVVDSDRDGVPDERDRCPGTPAGATVNAQGCELDSDRDGVLDRLDKCPGTRSGAKVDGVGCEIAEVITLKGVNFATNSARLTPGSTATLDAAASTLVKRGNVKTEVAGHTDDRGAAARNQSLSQQRADAVRKYLISKGVDPANITARGYGEDAPIADNKTEGGRAENRRVELRAQ
jgi:OOP family OmpA-OmpF porin